MISNTVPNQIIRRGVLVKFRETWGFILCNFINGNPLVEFVLNVSGEIRSTKSAPVEFLLLYSISVSMVSGGHLRHLS